MAEDKAIRKSLPLATPDFDAIKQSLKEYLKGQDRFTDYDFDGSVMGTLLDLLAYNSHFSSFYLNMVGNEAFLSTAVRRDSVVARAKALGYTPRSARSATALLFLTFTPTSPTPSFIDIPKGTKFSASAADASFTFTTNDDIRVTPDNQGNFIAPSVEVVEGKFLTHTFTISDDNIDGLVIPNPNVDTTKLTVEVSEEDTSTVFETFSLADDINQITDESQIYFVEEDEGGLHKVTFGDGVLGKAVTAGSKVKISYFITSGIAANGVGSFTLASSLTNVDDVSITVVSAATGGAAIEQIQGIKFSAPKHFEMQNRAVTASDYVQLVKEKYSNQEDVIAWGGEENDPPMFGFVFIAIKPVTGFNLTEAEKENVKALIKQFNVVSITPKVVNADFIFVDVDVEADFNVNETDKTAGQIITAVSNAIQDYNDSSINRFDKTLRFSVLSRVIDNADPSIVSNTLKLLLSKRYFPVVDVPEDLEVNFNNPIERNSLDSSKFTFNGFSGCFLRENPNNPGGVNIVRGENTVIATNIGTINIEKGLLTIGGFEVDALTELPQFQDSTTGDFYIRITATPTESDINPTQKQIVVIDKIDVESTPLTNFRQ